MTRISRRLPGLVLAFFRWRILFKYIMYGMDSCWKARRLKICQFQAHHAMAWFLDGLLQFCKSGGYAMRACRLPKVYCNIGPCVFQGWRLWHNSSLAGRPYRLSKLFLGSLEYRIRLAREVSVSLHLHILLERIKIFLGNVCMIWSAAFC